MENLLLWFIAIIAFIALVFGFVIGRVERKRSVTLLVVLIAPFAILVAVAGFLGSMIIVETWRKLAAGQIIDGEALGVFAIAYLVATCPAVVGALLGRVIRRAYSGQPVTRGHRR
jgi:hypothetical protein